MIGKENLREVLEIGLGYIKSARDIYIKEYTMFDCAIKVDFANEIISYPEDKGMIIHRKTTCNFSENENFVVLECITSLLDKGYKPENIELEKPMPGGHDDTGGFCDIQVKDNDGKTFILIECKKEDEFDKYWKKTLNDGGQLFRYYNSYRQAKALCLYTSDWSTGQKIKRVTNIISMQDNEEYLQTDASLKSFKQVQLDNGDKEDYFKVWKETYQQDYSTSGIFEPDIDVYTVGKLKYTVDDLEEVDYDIIQKKYHEFATILRQHNVGSHENAFDKLVNLFLAKIVDETINEQELQFYWKGAAFDDYYSLQDRLQKLYKEGMEKFLGEEVTYIDQKQISDTFHLFKNDPDATKSKILEYFRQLKFYTNSDFAFLDVHNAELFYQNAVILKKMVSMIEDIRLKSKTQNQFLGDLFEGFLDDGVKQSEGQYFTPLPIVKYIVSALPIKELIDDSPEPPKVIDYACGAGHFLTEYASIVKEILEDKGIINFNDYFKNIHGIEKEYRLSKVSKVSAFMYGQDDIQIIYGDALSTNEKIQNNTYSVLIANPPYSVKGFLETLSDQDREKYTLYREVSDIAKNNSIEVFFVERAKQLLKEGGMAAIVLPNSILTNGNLYVYCREILLKYFDIVAISEFDKGTFGKTGTKTVTLFLKKKNENPPISEHIQNRVNSWFLNDNDKDIVFQDREYLEQYCNDLKFSIDEYEAWLKGGVVPSAEIFNEYILEAKSSSEYKKIEKKKVTSKYTMSQKQEELEERIQRYIRNIEKEKLYYYILALNNENKIIVIKSPTETKKIKEFLGYEWSGTKGNEGLKTIGGPSSDDDSLTNNKGLEHIKTPLYDPQDLFSENKINTIIRKNFARDAEIEVPEELEEYVKLYDLKDLMDFTTTSFDKKIFTYPVKKMVVYSKYDAIPLAKYPTEIAKGTSITQAQTVEGPYKVVAGGVDFAYTNNAYNRNENVVTISASGANAGFVNFWDEKIFASDCTTVQGSSNEDTLYIYYYLKAIQSTIFSLARGSAQPHVYPADVKRLMIPKPDDVTKKDIVDYCTQNDKKIKSLEKELILQRTAINELVASIKGDKVGLSTLCDYKNGLNYKASTNGYALRIIGVGDFKENVTPEWDKLAEVMMEEAISKDYMLHEKDLLVVRSNGSANLVGRFLLIDKEPEQDTSYSGFTIRLRLKDQSSVDCKYLYYYLSQPIIRDRMMISSNGTNINNISQGVLDKVDVVIPESNQEKIRFTKEIEVIEKKIEEINKKLLVLRKTIKEKVEKTLELRIEFEQS